MREKVDGPSFGQAEIRSVTLGMGCFWNPDALFGHLPGVVRTRTGYAGGTSVDPVYRHMGDHTETVRIDFNPAIIAFEDILDLFWDSHNPANINDYKGTQYKSLLLYDDGEQEEAIRQVLAKRKEQGKSEPDTEVAPLSAFYPAEDKHQKYYLKRYSHAIEKLSLLYPSPEDRVHSTLAARLNGLAKGYTSLERIIEELPQWPIDPETRERMTGLIRQIRW
ncbi:peptide-methionine (S)-S-oxide reductase MsrA [Paenibacillus nasutitermitis]|uniref:Peptide methionine sulfoxide reductase MsrA n=1 Tax=Paenibacillus nasutitermitis TaxID=1652958 RepID=A0A916ZGZ0_9BACL|nr:peptide-methionine (S)-S-oxide reductase [Paenibacillus nasutitermitis]GGD97185.1 methionine-S-sulfoxide reductase [Paenibacillus nasutitermitis]